MWKCMLTGTLKGFPCFTAEAEMALLNQKTKGESDAKGRDAKSGAHNICLCTALQDGEDVSAWESSQLTALKRFYTAKS